MRSSAFILTLIGSLFLISCSQSKLPTVKDPEVLQQDCTRLFQQFPIIHADTNQLADPALDYFYESSYLDSTNVNAIDHRNIPASDWPSSVQFLKPIAVHRSNFGIYIWIKINKNLADSSEDWFAKGYFVSSNTNNPSAYRLMNSPFTEIGSSAVYEITEPMMTD